MDAVEEVAVTKRFTPENSVVKEGTEHLGSNGREGQPRKASEWPALRHRSLQLLQRFPSAGTLFSKQPSPRPPSVGTRHLSVRPSAGESCVNITVDPVDSLQPTAEPSTGTVPARLDKIQEGDEGAKNLYLDIYLPLYQAAVDGNWETAKDIFEKEPQAHSLGITRGGETVLHIAAATKHVKFLEELVKRMNLQDLAIQNKKGNTALCFAVASANVTFAKLMVDKNKNLPNIRCAKKVTPLYFATLLGHRDMAQYLFGVTDTKHLKTDDYVGIFFAAIGSNLYDVALDILKTHEPSVVTHRNDDGESAMHVLARKPSAFLGRSEQGFWRRCICSFSYFKDVEQGIMGIQNNISVHNKAHQLLESLLMAVLESNDSKVSNLITGPKSPIFVAAKLGNVEFLTVLIKSYPDLIWTVDDKNRSIFHIAVIYRQERIFNLIHKIGACKDMIAHYKDKRRNNMLHLAANLAPQSQLNKISGPALQMQQELIWFKEVEKVVPPSFMEMKNSKGVIPRDLFSEKHINLMALGEKWMKDTSNSCMVVATLITTVMFAAAFTIPGGNNGHTGSPIYLKEISFMVFAISDALSLFSSATSILMFLSILTSRYTETGFLISLPIRLIIGLATLFFSIATMMVAFSATFFILLHRGLAFVASLACVPVILFAFLQFPLFFDIIRSTYKASFLFHKHAVKRHI